MKKSFKEIMRHWVSKSTKEFDPESYRASDKEDNLLKDAFYSCDYGVFFYSAKFLVITLIVSFTLLALGFYDSFINPSFNNAEFLLAKSSAIRLSDQYALNMISNHYSLLYTFLIISLIIIAFISVNVYKAITFEKDMKVIINKVRTENTEGAKLTARFSYYRNHSAFIVILLILQLGFTASLFGNTNNTDFTDYMVYEVKKTARIYKVERLKDTKVLRVHYNTGSLIIPDNVNTTINIVKGHEAPSVDVLYRVHGNNFEVIDEDLRSTNYYAVLNVHPEWIGNL